jgi:hypothetical protein
MARRSNEATTLTTPEAIMRSANFGRGLSEVRAGRPFDWRVEDEQWAYERGRLLAHLVPVDMPLFISNKKLNPTMLAVFKLAWSRRYIT